MTHSLQSADQQLPFWWDLQVLQKHGPCCDVYSAVRAANWINPAGTASYAKYYLRTRWFVGLRVSLLMQETEVQSLGREDPLEGKMATHSSTLAWRIPWTEELGWRE